MIAASSRRLWFLLLPSASSELVDVLFASTWQEFGQSVIGGLEADRVLAVDETDLELRPLALELLEIVRRHGDRAARGWFELQVAGHLTADGEGRR